MNNKTDKEYTIEDFYAGQLVKIKDPDSLLLSNDINPTFKSYISEVQDQVLTIDYVGTHANIIRINGYLFFPSELVPAEDISALNISFDDFLKVLNDE